MINILVTIRRERAADYYKALSSYRDFRVRLITSTQEALELLRDQPHDVLILDNEMDGAFEFIGDLRHSYPRLLIVLVDEDADFAMPGQADDISTEPFKNDDLARRIHRLMSDRQLETLRADSLPPVREVAKKLRKAVGESGKQQAAVTACRELGYDYVAFYRFESADPFKVTLKAQDGPAAIQAVALKQATPEDVIGFVATTGQSRITKPEDEVNHPLVKRGRLGAAACVAVGTANRYGVLIACNEKPDSITQAQMLLLELICAQFAAVIVREQGGG